AAPNGAAPNGAAPDAAVPDTPAPDAAAPDGKAATAPAAGGRVADASATVLQVTGVSAAYGSRTVVDDVTFTLRPGETLGLVGESGSGKTTVARLVLGLHEPTQGEIQLHGRRWSGVRE